MKLVVTSSRESLLLSLPGMRGVGLVGPTAAVGAGDRAEMGVSVGIAAAVGVSVGATVVAVGATVVVAGEDRIGKGRVGDSAEVTVGLNSGVALVVVAFSLQATKTNPINTIKPGTLSRIIAKCPLPLRWDFSVQTDSQECSSGMS